MNRLVLASVDNLGLELRSMTAYRDPDTQPLAPGKGHLYYN